MARASEYPFECKPLEAKPSTQSPELILVPEANATYLLHQVHAKKQRAALQKRSRTEEN
jgi:hypothetical protein